MSARVAEAAEPRAVVVALHGGAVTSGYFDAPGRASLLRAGAALGFTVIALDRPGYGSSAPHGEADGLPRAAGRPGLRGGGPAAGHARRGAPGSSWWRTRWAASSRSGWRPRRARPGAARARARGYRAAAPALGARRSWANGCRTGRAAGGPGRRCATSVGPGLSLPGRSPAAASPRRRPPTRAARCGAGCTTSRARRPGARPCPLQPRRPREGLAVRARRAGRGRGPVHRLAPGRRDEQAEAATT